jgi:hypothetical protein
MWRFIFILVLVVACLGFYRGWFHVTSTKTGVKSDVTVTVDKGRIQEDKKAADEKARDLTQRP